MYRRTRKPGCESCDAVHHRYSGWQFNRAVLNDILKTITYSRALLCSTPKRFSSLAVGSSSPRITACHAAQPIADPTDSQHGREVELAQPEGGCSASVPAGRCLAVDTACPRAAASIPEPSLSPSSLRLQPSSSLRSPSAPGRTACTKTRPEPSVSKTMVL